MVFDNDLDLTEDFTEIVTGDRKKKPVKDFELSLDSSGFNDKDPIAVGHKRLFDPDGRRKKIKPLKKGSDFIGSNL